MCVYTRKIENCRSETHSQHSTHVLQCSHFVRFFVFFFISAVKSRQEKRNPSTSAHTIATETRQIKICDAWHKHTGNEPNKHRFRVDSCIFFAVANLLWIVLNAGCSFSIYLKCQALVFHREIVCIFIFAFHFHFGIAMLSKARETRCIPSQTKIFCFIHLQQFVSRCFFFVSLLLLYVYVFSTCAVSLQAFYSKIRRLFLPMSVRYA